MLRELRRPAAGGENRPDEDCREYRDAKIGLMDVTPESLGLVLASGGAAPPETRATGFQGVSEIECDVSDSQCCDPKQMRLGFVPTKNQQHNEECNGRKRPWVGLSQMDNKISEHLLALG